MTTLRIIPAAELLAIRSEPVTASVLAAVAPIVEDVRRRGEDGLRAHAERFGEIPPGQPLVLDAAELARRAQALPEADRNLLAEVAARIRTFAAAQRASIRDCAIDIESGRAGHTLIPVASAGCYAPGGRYPLPSTVLMTVCAARAAGVPRVIVASPKPSLAVIAAAHEAGADGLLVVGGAQAIAAMAYGVPGVLEPVDMIVGPGNAYVTAAKKLVHGVVGIDMLAGPSELTILEHDSGANPAVIAADLLAQAEHDDDAKPVLITTSADVAASVAAEVDRQLLALPTAATARRACANGCIAIAGSLVDAIRTADAVAPEHLEILARDPRAIAARCSNAGAVFLGEGSAEVFGDYGAGPNHTLPTGGSARFGAGLSVFTFLRARTWLDLSPTPRLIDQTARIARLEGLEAHARAAESRIPAPELRSGR